MTEDLLPKRRSARSLPPPPSEPRSRLLPILVVVLLGAGAVAAATFRNVANGADEQAAAQKAAKERKAAAEKAAAEKRAAEEAERRADHILQVTPEPEGATVRVDGKEVADPSAIDLGPMKGSVQIEVQKRGYETATRTVEPDAFEYAVGKNTASLAITLERQPQRALAHRHAPRRAQSASDDEPSPLPDNPF